MWLELIERRVVTDKKEIDEFVSEMVSSHISYLFKSRNHYKKILSFLEDYEDRQGVRYAIMRNRFYYEIKVSDMVGVGVKR